MSAAASTVEKLSPSAVASLRSEQHSTSIRVEKLETNLDTLTTTVNSGFNRLFNELTKLQSQPRYEPGKILNFVMAGAGLFSLVVSGIIFINSAINGAQFERVAGEVRVLELRVKHLQTEQTLRARIDALERVAKVGS